MSENNTELLIYQAEDGVTKVDVYMEDETVWLSLDQMAELFQRDKSTISRHIKNIFSEGELDEKAVVAKFATTAFDGKTYQVTYYNLDVIISVGYRVKSLRGTQFRIWANTILKEYLDFAELQAQSRKPMYMKDWIKKLDDFLAISERDILTGAGKVSTALAAEKAEKEFKKYKALTQDELSQVERDYIAFIEEAGKKVSREPS